jgi:hypothetical protein
MPFALWQASVLEHCLCQFIGKSPQFFSSSGLSRNGSVATTAFTV